MPEAEDDFGQSADEILRAFVTGPYRDLLNCRDSWPAEKVVELIDEVIKQLNYAVPNGHGKIARNTVNKPLTSAGFAGGINLESGASENTLGQDHSQTTSPQSDAGSAEPPVPATEPSAPKQRSRRQLAPRDKSTLRKLEILKKLRGEDGPLGLSDLMDHLIDRGLAAPSNKSTVVTQLSRMKEEGLINVPYKGFYEFTPEGLAYLKKYGKYGKTKLDDDGDGEDA